MRVITSEGFFEILTKISKQNQIGQSVSNKVYQLHRNLEVAETHAESELAFNRLRVTNHGETRIKHCVKYDLGQGYRLVTIKHKGIISLEYVGNHDDTDKWLDRNAGKTLITDGSTLESVNRIQGIQQVSWMEGSGEFPMNSSKPLLDFLKEKDLGFIESLSIPNANYRRLMRIYAYSNKEELERALTGLPEREHSFLSSLFKCLYEDDLEGAT